MEQIPNRVQLFSGHFAGAICSLCRFGIRRVRDRAATARAASNKAGLPSLKTSPLSNVTSSSPPAKCHFLDTD